MPQSPARRRTPLPAEQQLSLWRAARGGDEGARDELVLGNQGIVHALARQTLANGEQVSYPDLVQEGNLALLDAIGRFDEERGAPFPAWAATVVRRHLSDFCASQRQLGGLAIRLPRQTWSQLRALEQAERELACRQEPITTETLARLTGMPAETINHLLFLRMRRREELGPERPGRFEPADELSTESAEEAVWALERQRIVAAALDQLEPRQKQVLCARFGLEGEERRSEDELADEWHVSRSVVAGLQRRALARLSTVLQALRTEHEV